MSHEKKASPFRDKDATGTAYAVTVGVASAQLFPEVPEYGAVERIIHNPSTTAYIAVRLTPMGTANPPAAALNTGGSITLAPLEKMVTEHTGAIQAIGQGAGQPITAMER